ncbi:polysaccharide biosynthesis protein [Crocinitomix catalasitica]|nr:polysaccharide biosynthesis protein [Crocinitomix catalasitica]
MSIIKKLAGQTAVYGLSSIIGRLLNYFLVPLHTYIFLPDEFGVISIFYAYVAFFVVLLTFGMQTTFFRFVNKSDDKEKTFNQALSLVIILNTVFLAVAILSADRIAYWMGYPDYGNYVIWFACILAFDATSSVVMAKLRFLEKPKRFAFIQLTSIGVNIGLNLFFLLILYDSYPEVGIGFIFLANLFASCVKPLLLYKELSTYRFVMDKVMTKAMIIFTVPLVIAGFAGIINESLDRILLKFYLPEDAAMSPDAQIGIYSANYKIAIFITLFIQAFRYAVEPFFFAQEKEDDRDKNFSKVMTWFVIVVSLMFLVIALNLDIFKWFIPNETFHEGLVIVPIILLANVCLGIYFNQSIWYKLADKTLFGAYIAIGGAAITIGLNIWLIPTLGYIGSAWATLACYFTMMVASHVLGQRIYPIKYNLRKVGLYLFSAIGLYFLGVYLSFDSFGLTFGVHTALILLYIGLVFIMEQPLKALRKN